MLTASNLRGGRDYAIAIKPEGIDENSAISARLDRKRRRVVIRNVNGSKFEKVTVKAVIYTRQGGVPKRMTKRIRRGHGWTLKL
jgi:hypothetical protein